MYKPHVSIQDQTEVYVDDMPHSPTHFHNQTEYDAKGLGVSGGVNVKVDGMAVEKIKKGDQAIASTNQLALD